MYPIRYPFDGSYKVNQTFGANPDKYSGYDLEGHNGIDFGTPLNTEIKAVCDATVRYAGYDPDGYGNYIRLDHHIDNNHFQTLHAHSDQLPFFVKGDVVKEGVIIMLSGNTGYSSGPHLHFGLREIDANGNVLNEDNGYMGYIDPQPWFDAYKTTSSIPSWAYPSVEWAVNNNILDSYESAKTPVELNAYKYTLILMIYRYYLNIDNGTQFIGTLLSGSWPAWANEAISWAIYNKIIDSIELAEAVISKDAFKYTFAVILYKYYRNVMKGAKFTGALVSGGWPTWANEAVSWALSIKLYDNASSVMQPVNEVDFKYTVCVILDRYCV